MEGKLRENAGNAVKAILETARFEVQDVEAPLDFSAMREGETLLVLCSNNPSEIEEFDRTKYCLKIENEELDCKKLLFTLNDSARADHCIRWGSTEFIRYAGEAALARVLERTLLLSFAGVPEASEASGAREPSLEVSSGITLPHLPIKVNKQSAQQIAGIQGSISLRFLPYWFFTYQSSGEKVYQDHRIPFDSEGSGAINAINGMRVPSEGMNFTESEIPAGSEVVKPRISREDAAEQITQGLIEKLTQKVRIKQVKGDAIFYEDKVIKPDRKNLGIEIQQMYIPVWQIKGKKILEINAFSGEILSEPMDEGVEIL
ncbi:MAG TPA: hypothetical protein PLN56_05070 [Methanoregulaceae archaeon]|nr:hypothetical protein [Methanoregulaceae archaeon]HPD10353.1 hypothetical protein [Methanoregulaceae archaeon]HRT15418.1 hypothetical protein [Methanoregulaceae archaeon]HRU30891.1 hypothetical protein [Methanoregulaceae archaeon]